MIRPFERSLGVSPRRVERDVISTELAGPCVQRDDDDPEDLDPAAYAWR
jgi:hypothetical protein